MRPSNRLRLSLSLPWIALLAVPFLAACTGGGDNESSNPALGDRRLALVVPQSLQEDVTVSSGPLTLEGQVLDLDGLGFPSQVEWRVEQPADTLSGEADVDATGSWSVDLPLASGDNYVRVSVPASTAELEFTATLNPGYAFSGQLQVVPDVVYVGEPREITAAIALLDPETDPATVELVRIEPSGEAVVAVLTDDGNLANGDEIQGDGIYTGRFLLTEADPGQVPVRVVVQQLTSSDEARSETFEVLATAHLTDGELQEVLALQGDLQARLDQAAFDGALEEEVDAIVAELASTPGVAQAGENDSGRGVYVAYECGIAGVLYASTSDQRSGGRTLQRQGRAPAPAAVAGGRSVDYAPYAHFYKPGSTASAGAYVPSATQLVEAATEPPPLGLAEEDENLVGSARALGIGAQFWDWGSTEADQALAVLSDQGCFETTLVQYAAAGAGSVEDFKNLGAYGVVIIATHGDSFYNGILSLWTDQFGWNIPFTGVVILHSNMAVTIANRVTYEDDLKKGRLVVWGNDYGIAPSFVQRYGGSMPNSLIWMGICRGAFNGTMASAFLSRGAGSYLSFDEYVSVSWPINLCVQTMQTLAMDGMDLSDAFTAGQLDPNYSDTNPNPFGAAEWVLFGSDDLSLDLEGIQDGGFESNSITQAWSVVGDGRILQSLGASAPTEGGYMGIVSTGLGFTTDSGTIRQRFCMPAGAETISFDWNFFSEEFLEYVGSVYQDAFIVTLAEVGDPTSQVEILNEYVDSLAGQVSPVANSFDQGDVYATGWLTTVGAIPESLRGKQVELSFFATDVGDSIYDTAVLIDAIEIQETGAP